MRNFILFRVTGHIIRCTIYYVESYIADEAVVVEIPGQLMWIIIWGGETVALLVYTVEPPLKETPNKGQDSEHQNVTFL